MLSRMCVAAALAGMALSAGPARAAVVNHCVQFAPGGTVLIRAIEDDPGHGCPAASVDGRPVALTRRGPSQARRKRPRLTSPF